MPPDPSATMPWMARRKARHGDGSYRRRGPNAWQLRWMVDGSVQTETVHGTEQDARARLKRVTADAAEGLHSAGLMQRTVGDILRYQLAHYERENLASLATCRAYIARMIDAMGSIRVVRLRTADIQRFANSLIDRGLSPASANRHLEVLKAAFRRASREDPPLVNRVPPIERFPERNVREGFLQAEDYERLMSHIEADWLKLMFAFGYHYGARAGAILAIRWSQVDWQRRVIRPPANQPRNKRVGVWPIYGDPERLRRKAEFHHEEFWPHVPWVFHRDGKRIPQGGYRNAWSKARESAGFPGLRFHDLRRTAARNMAESGIDDSLILRVVGWKTRAMLLRYRIIDERGVVRAGERIDRYLRSLERPGNAREKNVQ